jgi:UDP-N-acetyl-D-glucosamine dehydrogenase
VTREHPRWAGHRSISWNKEDIGAYDAALIVTAHANVNYAELVEWSSLIIDTRNALKEIKERSKIWKA